MQSLYICLCSVLIVCLEILQLFVSARLSFSVKIGHERFPEKNQVANAVIKFYNEKLE